jgi:CheY-like chemotaxis protein
MNQQRSSCGSRLVLVADDNCDAADCLAVLLRFEGLEVHIAYDGLKAIECADALHPHAAVLDINMPGATGYEVARWIRNQAWGRCTALVALTALDDAQTRSQARSAGFDTHLTKPADATDIMRAFSDLM